MNFAENNDRAEGDTKMSRMVSIGLSVALLLGTFATTTATQEKVTLCHAAGLNDTTKFVTLTVGWPAAFGPAGHFYENGTPRAGHEQDYLGPCQETPVYDVDASITICGDPRAVILLLNQGTESVKFNIKFINALGYIKSIYKTVLPDSEKYMKRWVLGRTFVMVFGEKEELLERAFVNRKSNVGPCSTNGY
jgi:hypothetical protein